MDLKSARAAIEAILAAIPDEEFGPFDRIEYDQRADGLPIAWIGGRGYNLGSAKTNGDRDPSIYHRHAADDAIEGEMVYRADRMLFENGDNPSGVVFTVRKRVA